jgi:hypothetical protein
VVAETAISVYSKKSPARPVDILIYPNRAKIDQVSTLNCSQKRAVDQLSWANAPGGNFNLQLDNSTQLILEKISGSGIPLIEICDFCLGLTPYDKAKGHTPKEIEDRVFHSTHQSGKAWKPLLEGADINRYDVSFGGNEYIKYGPWLGAPRDSRFFTEPRILVRQIISGKPPRIYAGYTENELYNSQVAFNILSKTGDTAVLKFILAILCSSLMTWYHRQKFLDLNKTTFQKILIQDAKTFPIPKIKEIEGDTYKRLIGIVERRLALMPSIRTAKTDAERNALQNAIRKTDRDIDQLVYQLYGLTPEEIALVEGIAANSETVE